MRTRNHSFAVTQPAIVGFKSPYQRVREEEGAALICLERKRNLDQNDTVMVVTLQQGTGDEVATGIVILFENQTHIVMSLSNTIELL